MTTMRGASRLDLRYNMSRYPNPRTRLLPGLAVSSWLMLPSAGNKTSENHSISYAGTGTGVQCRTTFSSMADLGHCSFFSFFPFPVASTGPAASSI